MSIRELNANVSRALSVAEAGDDIVLTRKGKPFLRITREGVNDAEARRASAVARLREMMAAGVDLGGPASYEERTGR
jgi:antitoxin (DNA-binding transcriptional repressor) of toxin-antitoxin stability system